MAKKKPLPNPNGLIAGYLRMSDVKFPDGCTSVADREAFVDQLRRIRMSELIQDAERDRCKIDVWYDDIGISGRGEYLAKRLAYQSMLRDAKAKKLRAVYARDLSRLGRDLIEQESFFLQLEACAVDVRVADLPTSGDPAARTLVRQQLGSLNQYMATKNGQTVAQVNLERVRTGQWVGRTHSMWGLRYNKETKFFDFDPVTADHAVWVYETFIECHGLGRAAALRLQKQFDEGHPRAVPPPQGGIWRMNRVLDLARSELYRRKIKYKDLLIDHNELPPDAPNRLPEVVPRHITDEVDRLLAVRAPIGALVSAGKAGRLTHTYGAGLLICRHCGRKMRTSPERTNRGKIMSSYRIAWTCSLGSVGDAQLCTWNLSAQQFRIDALAWQGLRTAFELYKEEPFSTTATRRKKASKPKSSVADALAKLDIRRDRLLDALETCEPDALPSINARLKAVAEERIRLKSMPEATEVQAETQIADLTYQEWKSLYEQMDQVWKTEGDALSYVKHDFMKTLQMQIIVNILPREPKKPRKEGNTKTYAGLVNIELSVGALGLVGDKAISLTETEDTFQAYLVWRGDIVMTASKHMGRMA
ncbi:MAG: recombinase family protein [Capsulimonas sp.]|uniref:recombinase family protein n=1 Tax=Capsulimonas sp. TaxID=2494211 RepID=UPI003266B982